MTRKLQPITSRRVILRLSWKLVIVLSLSLFLVALFKLHAPPSELTSSSRAASISRSSRSAFSFNGTPKIAFLFIGKSNIPLDFLWDAFFENADTKKFSVYVHLSPGFVLDESSTKSHFFFGRQLNNSIKVEWGEWSMIEAERLLLRAALSDPANQRFVLLSDSCVPLYNFSYVYNYVMASARSFVDSFLDTKDHRYSPKMSPYIPQTKWRKGSQWITLIRSHAEVVVDDNSVFPVFKRLCKRRPPVNPNKGALNYKLQKQHNCIPDEHYVQTLLAMHELEGELERRTLTYTLWNQSNTKTQKKAWHPVMFNYADAGPHQIKQIKDINHVYYETEFRTEWCHSNFTSVPCFLFARKFSQGAAMHLLSDGVVN